MGGDYSRSSFDALRDYAGVLLQQGHPTLDADWNELVAIIERRLRVQTVDTIGRAVVPLETPTGFEVKLAAGPKLTIGRGRMYVHGLLAENHGRIGAGAAPVFDRSRDVDGEPAGVLDESISAEANDFVDYAAQPYLPVPPALPAIGGPHLVYLDVWRREVTPLKDPRLLEPALGGIDTATRWQTVWQVRLLENVGAGATCASDLAAWDALIAPSPSRLTTATIEFEDPDEPCLIPPGGGYRGLENQLYRVEIHSGGALGTARFKWSRDNASVGATIEAVDNGDRLEVRRIGRDSLLRFRTGDWVEITDDRREFAGKSGDIRRLTAVDEDSNTLTLNAALTADLIPGGGADTAAARHSRVIKWDQSGLVLKPDGTTWEDLDAVGSDGLIPVPADGSPIVLEAGITVSFAVDPSGNLRALDHWAFAARTEGAQIEILEDARPIGIHHHHARLAMITLPGTVGDCRIFWPPAFGGEDCGCTICVSAEGHNSGALTIQTAIGQLPPEGGTICLGPGEFLLGETPVEIADRTSVRLRGHGPGSLLVYAGAGGAIRVRGSNNVRISDLSVIVVALESSGGASAIHLRTNWLVDVNHVAALVYAPQGGEAIGIALDGLHLGLGLDDNLVIAPDAIRALPRQGAEDSLAYCGLFETHVTRNLLFAQRRGIMLDGTVLHLGATSIADNGIFAGVAAVVATGAGTMVGGTGSPAGGGDSEESWSTSPLTVRANVIGLSETGDGIVSGVPNLRVLDNDISAPDSENPDQAGGSCIRLVDGFMPVSLPSVHIIGNRIGNVGGFGLSIEAPQDCLLVKQNMIRDCRSGGITMAPEGRVKTLSLDNNVIERVATRRSEQAGVAVRLAGVTEARVIGNSVRRIGLGGTRGGFFVGFDMDGVPTLDFSHNVITEIGYVGALELVGVRLTGPLLACAISGNRIADMREMVNGDPASWCAIQIGEPALTPGVATRRARGEDTRGAAFFARGETIYALGARFMVAMAPLREAQVRLSGNLITDAHQRSELNLVEIELGLDGKAVGACSFSDNQCTLRTGGRPKSIVQIRAPRLVVANNVVRRTGDADAMHLWCAGGADKPMATIIGNLSSGKIVLNNGSPPAAFIPLNVIAQ
ncbi:MAG TPA: DUF6519 domain-containing protein [Allosphingosinicella sp.]|nr:DUF6519 domain-containing protein [Allosphingosinicella sp.]